MSDQKLITPNSAKEDQDQRIKLAVDASMRAMSGDKHLYAQFSGHDGQALTPASYLLRQSTKDDHELIAKLPDHISQDSLRGSADSIALHVKHHDKDNHRKYAPSAPNARLYYDMFEQVRCEALGTKHLKGVRQNIMESVEQYCRQKGYGDPARSIPIPREDSLFAFLREEFFDLPNKHDFGSAMSTASASSMWLHQKISTEDLEALKENLDQPDIFAKLASSLSQHLMNDRAGDDRDENDQDTAQEDQATQSDIADDEDAEEQSQEQESAAAQSDEDQDTQEEQDLGVEEDEHHAPQSADHAEGSADPLDQTQTNAENIADSTVRYKIFTQKHDQILHALELASDEELHHLRDKLDKQLDPLKAVVSKLANRLQRRLMAQQQRSWQFDVDEGILDPARLARIVTTPGSPLSYKREKDTDFKDTVVSLLIDNSGSMRGRPITIAALSTDILTRTLERCGIKVEILGFTTSAWKGGFSREDWGKAGRPNMPGRLNDILHIIYKSADSPWIRTRKNLGLMLKDGLLKENIDGEALRWAHNRIRRRPEYRKILMVISDGAPVDDSTLSANYAQFLEHDLIHTIQQIERQKQIELLAIGIGHDVTPYYKRAVTIKQAEELGSTMIDELVKLFTT